MSRGSAEVNQFLGVLKSGLFGKSNKFFTMGSVAAANSSKSSRTCPALFRPHTDLRKRQTLIESLTSERKAFKTPGRFPVDLCAYPSVRFVHFWSAVRKACFSLCPGLF